MKKKSLVAMGLAGVMTIGMCVPVLAAEFGPTGESNGIPTLPDSGGNESAASVTIVEPITYKVTIPASFTVSGKAASISFKVENINLEPDCEIIIAPKESGVELTNNSKNSVKWNMKFVDGESDFTSASFNNESSQPEKTISLKDGTNTGLEKRPAGTYVGTTTFTVTYKTPTVTP